MAVAWYAPPPRSSHYQNYHICSRGSPLTFTFHWYWEGEYPKVWPMSHKRPCSPKADIDDMIMNHYIHVYIYHFIYKYYIFTAYYTLESEHGFIFSRTSCFLLLVSNVLFFFVFAYCHILSTHRILSTYRLAHINLELFPNFSLDIFLATETERVCIWTPKEPYHPNT